MNLPKIVQRKHSEPRAGIGKGKLSILRSGAFADYIFFKNIKGFCQIYFQTFHIFKVIFQKGNLLLRPLHLVFLLAYGKFYD